MRELHFHNTLTGEKQKLQTIKPGEVGIYVCGITPYDEAHLGHARCYVVFDVLKRTLQRHGYKVKHVQNFTDIDDKIIDRAKQTNSDPHTHAQKYIDSFNHWMKELNVAPADVYPCVTTHIQPIIELIKRLVERGVAYESQGDVYFAVRKFPAYGRLSKRKLDELAAGARVEVSEIKKDPLDFALWKKAKPGEPSWESPWGQGRPGWHIECSAMSMKYLGEEFDLHGGGQDLIFPHHENEVAQSVGATGKAFAHHWIHNGFVTINEEKMSKSLGNFFSLKDIFAATAPMSVRYFLLTQHYRSPLNYSDTDLKVAESAWLNRVCKASQITEQRLSGSGTEKLSSELEQAAQLAIEEFDDSLANDLNTPGALGALNQFCSVVFKTDQSAGKNLNPASWKFLHDGLAGMLSTLGLKPIKEVVQDAKALELLEARQAARKDKNWAEADRIRDELKKIGWTIEDTAEGPKLKHL